MNWEQLEDMAIPEPNSGCLLWNVKSETPNGYGTVWNPLTKKYTVAHRKAYELVRGPIPRGLLVCHVCDVPACINPYHLFLGTHKDNTADMLRKGRNRPHTSRQLSDNEVMEIFRSPKLYKDIGKEFGILASTISQIKRGERFTRVTGKTHENKSHCAQGHLWIEENIRRRPDGSGYCRLCDIIRQRNKRRGETA